MSKAELLAVADEVEKATAITLSHMYRADELLLPNEFMEAAPWIAFAELGAFLDAVEALRKRVLPGWWWDSVGENRTKIKFAGDTHLSLGNWHANLQHVEGGRLQEGFGSTEPLARLAALLRSKAEGGE